MKTDQQTETQDVTTTESSEVTHDELSTKIAENNKIILEKARENARLQKQLDKYHRREVKMARKNRRKNNTNGEKKDPSGFNKATPVPPEFCEQPWGCTKGQELPRTVLTKMVYDYIKEFNLQKPEDKRVIDTTSNEHGKVLRKLFHLKKSDVLQFQNFQTRMAMLYPGKRDQLEAWVDEDAVTTKSKKKKKTKSKKKKASSSV